MVEQIPATEMRAPPRRRFASGRAIMALLLREMATTYGRSPLGYLWAIMEPVAGIFLLTLVFSAMMRSPPLGNNFAIFYASGIVVFTFYAGVANKLMASLGFSRQLLVYPSVTFVDSIIARFVLAVLTQLLVAYFIFTAILMFYDTRTVVDLEKIFLGISMAASMGAGVGVMNCFLTGVFPAWGSIWSILNRPLFIISCVIFLFEDVPQPYRDWLWWNPLAHISGKVRSGFYPYYEAAYVTPQYVFTVAAGLFLFGLLFLRKYHRSIMQR